MSKKIIFSFIGYFVLFPYTYLISSFLWRYFIRKTELWIVITDCLSILGIYYILISLAFVIYIKQGKT
ncbi:hypothetical protein IKE_06465 [Bacillus cereus VD196]|uniref:Uncharacterized protein n=1 Tax=Bacillus cereus VD196 TaxID=1053243 RepID=A0A9W5V5E4_BACCE|nr:hypothetical protein IKE_06465 [Bacillus cereus VD196]